jgi:ABC-type multidrug transport system fused ATPase/permease subunit
LELVFIIFFLALIFIARYLENPVILAPALVTIGIASFRLAPILSLIVRSVVLIRYGRDASDRIYKVLFEEPDITSPASMQKGIMKSADTAPARLTFDNQRYPLIECKNLDFSYGAVKPVLENASLAIYKGEAIGIKGVSGAGKTTLIDLLLGFLEPTSGEVLISGISLKGCLSEWHEKIAYIPQHTFIRDASVTKNVAFGRQEDIDLDAVQKAIEFASLEKVVELMESGLETSLGESGAKLSGGQIQRFAIARAIYFNREVIFMDEATSALDDSTEAGVLDSLAKLKGDRTLIIIAHRESTLRFCDRIIEVGNGSIQSV